MRIGIDARELAGHPTGAGRYLAGLLKEWGGAERFRRHQFVLYTPTPATTALDPRWFAVRLVAGTAGTWWEQMSLPRAAASDHLDVFFSPAYTAPLRAGVPIVLTVHDVSFIRHPEWFRAREGLRRRFLTRKSADRARAIVTISEFSRSELIELLSIPAERVHVIPPGVTPVGTQSPGAPETERILFVGSVFNRRHVPDLIRAFGILARRRHGALLDLVGDNRSYPHEDIDAIIVSEGLNGRVRWHRYVADGELRALYSGARAFVFLSEYEGLGLTPLEALAAGVPPLLLETPVARESCRDAALYVAKGDLSGTARALEQLLVDEATRGRLLGAAPAVLARYCWARAAEQTLIVIESAGNQSIRGQSSDASRRSSVVSRRSTVE